MGSVGPGTQWTRHMLGVILALGLLTVFLFYWNRKCKKLPPGPPRIPVLGSVPFISMRRGIMDWVLDKSITQNKLATVGIGPRSFFIINDFEMAKELFGKEEFSGRTLSEFVLTQKYLDGKRHGILVTEGSHWTKVRRFGIRTLKDFGFGKQSLEATINFEVEETVKKFLSVSGSDFYLSTDFNIPIINILWQLVASTRFTEEDPEGQKMIESVTKMFKCHLKMTMVPLRILKMFPKFTEYDDNVEIYNVQKRFVSEQIEQHEATLDSEYQRDYIDAFLNEMNAKEVDRDFSKLDLATSMMDFIGAGTEASATTLKWIVLYLTLYQDVQDKCRQEISQVLATSRCTMADMANLPFVQATISEVQRLAQVLPLSIAHRTLSPTQVDGFTFPSGSAFFANLSFIMKDPNNFPQPEVFDPSRFINENAKYCKNERFIPFGIGKRYCMGELLARNEVFLFTVNLVQRLQFLPPVNNLAPDPANYHAGLTNIPDDFHIKIVPAIIS